MVYCICVRIPGTALDTPVEVDLSVSGIRGKEKKTKPQRWRGVKGSLCPAGLGEGLLKRETEPMEDRSVSQYEKEAKNL